MSASATEKLRVAEVVRLPARAQLGSVLGRALARMPEGLLRAALGRPVVVDGQELHAEAHISLKLLELSGSPALETLSVEDARALVLAETLASERRRCRISRVEQMIVDGGVGPLDARLYVPSTHDGGLLLYFHGGGFVVCDLDTHDNACRFLAEHAGVQVLSVDYRRAPENRFPAAPEDALAAFHFALEHATELGADPTRVAVGGDSAGANLAAGVACLAAHDRPAPVFQLLFYPWLDLSRKRASYELFGGGFFLTEGELDWYRHHYLSHQADALDPRCSPLLTKELGRASPAFIATAGFDPLRDEGEEYASRLREAGVRVALRRHTHLLHGFVTSVGMGRVGREALLEAAGALRMALSPARSKTS